VWAVSQRDRLRDVPLPPETAPASEGPAAWISRGAIETWEEMPESSLVELCGKAEPWNRERELGLDRRETG
jgi:hypothetical protein